MADFLSELGQNLFGAGLDKTIAAANPYADLQAVPDTISSLIGQTVAKSPTRYGLGEVALASGLSGLLSGGVKSFSDNYALDAKNRYQNVLLKRLVGGDSSADEAGLSPLLVKSAQDQADLYTAQQGLSDKADLNKSINSTKGQLLGQAQAIAELSSDPKNAGLIGKLTGEKEKAPVEIPNTIKEKLANSKGLIDEALGTADQIDSAVGEGKLDWASLAGSKYFSGLDETGVRQRLSYLGSKLLNSISGTAASEQERGIINRIIAGDSSLKPAEIATFLRNFAQTESRYANSTLGVMSAGNDVGKIQQQFAISTTPKAVVAVPSVAAAAIPAGYTPEMIAYARKKGLIK